MFRLAAIFAIAALSACAAGGRVMTKAECRSADWGAYGFADGVAGAPPALENARAAACHGKSAPMDHAAYRNGRERGLRSFCAPAQGYRMGERGEPYRGQCAAYDEDGFVAQWEGGYELYGYTSAVDEAAGQLARAEAERERVRTMIAELTGGAFSGAIGTALPAPQAAARLAALYQAERRLTDRDIPSSRQALTNAQIALDGYLESLSGERSARLAQEAQLRDRR